MQALAPPSTILALSPLGDCAKSESPDSANVIKPRTFFQLCRHDAVTAGRPCFVSIDVDGDLCSRDCFHRNPKWCNAASLAIQTTAFGQLTAIAAGCAVAAAKLLKA